MAEMMQADLEKVGIHAKLVSYEWGEYRKRMQAGEHQMGLLGWTGDNGDPDNFFSVLLGCDAEGKPERQNIPNGAMPSSMTPCKARCSPRKPTAPSSIKDARRSRRKRSPG